MKVDITFKQMESSDAIKDFVERKAEKIKKFIVNPIDLHIVLSIEKGQHIAEINLLAKHLKLTAEGKTNDLYASIESAIDKLAKQAQKRRDKTTKHKNPDKKMMRDSLNEDVEQTAEE